MSTSSYDHFNTYGAIFASLILACVCTAIEGFVAHAFQQTLGDIVITENSLNDVGYITQARQGNVYDTFKDSSLHRGHDTGSNSLSIVMTTMGETQPSPIGIPSVGGKRLDARGFFQALPMGG